MLKHSSRLEIGVVLYLDNMCLRLGTPDFIALRPPSPSPFPRKRRKGSQSGFALCNSSLCLQLGVHYVGNLGGISYYVGLTVYWVKQSCHHIALIVLRICTARHFALNQRVSNLRNSTRSRRSSATRSCASGRSWRSGKPLTCAARTACCMRALVRKGVCRAGGDGAARSVALKDNSLAAIGSCAVAHASECRRSTSISYGELS